MPSSSPPISGDKGLLWADGIEPGDPSVCEAPTGKHCWWVDAAAPAGGSGSFAHPYNSFEKVIGYVNEQIQGFIPGQAESGDYVYVRGSFDATKSTEAHRLTIEVARDQQCGTPTVPTVIKSWRGSTRAVFDGGLKENDLILVRNCDGLRIQNIEIAHHGGRGLAAEESVGYLDINSVYIHDGVGDGTIGIGGGIILYATDGGVHHYIVRNSVFTNNKVNQSGAEGNIGALSILGEPDADPSSSAEIYNNIFDNEVMGIRHKHTTDMNIEAYNNQVSNCTWAFGARMGTNSFHHNVIMNCVAVTQYDSWNMAIPTTYAKFYNNTFYNVGSLVEASPEYPDSPGHDVARTFDFADNIYFNGNDSHVTLFDFYEVNGELTSRTQIHLSNNVLFYKSGATVQYFNTPLISDSARDNWATQNFTESGTLHSNPQFNHAADGDFSLKAGSPAIGSGTNGVTRGAIY
jgi:hypothetical protein